MDRVGVTACKPMNSNFGFSRSSNSALLLASLRHIIDYRLPASLKSTRIRGKPSLLNVSWHDALDKSLAIGLSLLRQCDEQKGQSYTETRLGRHARPADRANCSVLRRAHYAVPLGSG
ncbi:hypothetical protein EVAR_90246_1 [Eumeta japonica]|uniref:Uncharacterized protein n=1 Tax=Eumeta variegata TaxID=151549 RepID=A0A4C1YR25_EUMVA|nr:hypothetical protein EVAR_90246_1 [Eumeta japonica]